MSDPTPRTFLRLSAQDTRAWLAARADAIIKHLQQIIALGLIERRQYPIIKDQQIRLGQRGEALAEAPVAMGDPQFLEETRGVHIDG